MFVNVLNVLLFLVDLEDVVPKETCRSLKHSFLLKVLSKRLFNTKQLIFTLYRVWNPTTEFEYMEMENDIFLNRFHNEHDTSVVEGLSSWCFNGSLLALKRWEPGVVLDEVSFFDMMTWI